MTKFARNTLLIAVAYLALIAGLFWLNNAVESHARDLEAKREKFLQACVKERLPLYRCQTLYRSIE